jgi:hypothetical protein
MSLARAHRARTSSAARLAGLLALGLLGATGCARHRLEAPRYTLPTETSASGPRGVVTHPRVLAVRTFVDARAGEDAEDAAIYRYRGRELEPTDLSALERSVGDDVAEIIARDLVASRSFSTVVLLPPRAPLEGVDLVLDARVRRARGYVERPPPREDTTRTATSPRLALAEVWIDGLTLREARSGQTVLRAELGWAIQAMRPAVPAPPSPWAVLGEALGASSAQLVRLVREARLDGTVVLPEQTALTASVAAPGARTSSTARLAALADARPPGYTLTATRAAAPIGWRHTAGACVERALVEQHTQRFHRALGPYVATARVTVCGPEASLRFDVRAAYPARFIGRDTQGARYFVHAIGRGAWARPVEALERWLGIEKPATRYTFELGPER